MDNSRSYLAFVAIILLVLAVLAGLTYANYRFVLQNPGGNDFLARWMGARYWLVNGVSPYDPSVSLATQQAIYGHPADPAKGEDKNHFVYPLNSMLFFGPFGLVYYTLSRTVWMTVLELSLIGLAFISLRLIDWKTRPITTAIFVLFSLTWYHGMRTIIIGQFSALNALLIILGIYLIVTERDFGAGLLLSLTTAKPQMVFLLLPFLILWAISVRRWELIWGILFGIFVQLGLTLALLPDWPRQMLMQMLDYPTYTTIGSPLSIIAGAAPGIYRPLNIFLHAVFLVYMLVEWYLAFRKGESHFLWAALLTLVITNLVAFRTATTNYVVLLPVLFYIFKFIQSRFRIAGIIVIWLLSIVLWAGLWTLFLMTVNGNIEHPIMYIPLPFICLAGLWWVRWWATQAPRMPLEAYLKKFPG